MKFLCLGSKSIQIFDFVVNPDWGCSKCIQIALFAFWNNSDFQCLFLIGCLISCIFYNRCSICTLKVVGVAPYIGLEHKLRRIVSSTSVQDLNRAAPATFRTQIEQVQMHFEQPQIRFRTKWKFECLLCLTLRNLNACYKLKKNLIFLKILGVSCTN